MPFAESAECLISEIGKSWKGVRGGNNDPPRKQENKRRGTYFKQALKSCHLVYAAYV